MLCLLQLLLWWIRFWRNGYLWLSSLVGYIWLQRCRYFIVRGLEIFAVLWYNSNSKKATSERNLWFAWGGRKYGVWIATTFLTIYGFGLCGISVSKSTRKQWFQIQKYQKSLKTPYFTRLLAFGSMQAVSCREFSKTLKTLENTHFFGCYPFQKNTDKMIWPQIWPPTRPQLNSYRGVAQLVARDIWD